MNEPEPISPVQAFRGAVASMDRLLVSLDPEQWRVPALRGLTVQELVGHLTGVERRAPALPLQAPDAASLRLMTDLAVAMLPAGMRRNDRRADGRTARIVLTGPGGGTWQTDLGAVDDSRPAGRADVRIVLDAVDFCRLVANRADPATLTTVVSGDHALARDIFAGAARLALD